MIKHCLLFLNNNNQIIEHQHFVMKNSLNYFTELLYIVVLESRSKRKKEKNLITGFTHIKINEQLFKRKLSLNQNA